MSKFDVTGKRALITGGSRGIGFAIAQALGEAGADLALLARNMDGLHQAREKLQNTGRDVGVYAFDLSNAEGIPAMYGQICEDTGGVDILVNNAGVVRRGPAEEITLADWNLVMDVNVTAMFALCQAFARERIGSQRRGSIINIASLMSEAARPGVSPYAVSKGAVKLLTKALAVEWAEHGINVNAIGPGWIRTDLNISLQADPKFSGWVEERTPLGRWGIPEDVATTAVFLASEAAGFITGQVLYVDGGWLATF